VGALHLDPHGHEPVRETRKVRVGDIGQERRIARDGVQRIAHGALVCPGCNLPVLIKDRVPAGSRLHCGFCDHHAPDDEDFREWPAHNIEGTPGADVWPDLAPQPGDHVVRKRTYSAFVGTDFGPLLDRLGADELVLTGCATEVQLAATAMEALQRGFVVTIPPECQAGVSQVAELVTMATLGAMPPFEPRYLRR